MLAPRKILHSTPENVLKEAFAMAELTSDDIFCDIGCGDGRSLIFAASQFGIQSVGIEIDHERVETATAKVQQLGLNHLVQIHCGNAMEFNFEDATVIFLFLIERGLRLILPKLKQIKHPIKVVTYLYKFNNEVPVHSKFCDVDGKKNASFPLYLYHFNSFKS